MKSSILALVATVVLNLLGLAPTPSVPGAAPAPGDAAERAGRGAGAGAGAPLAPTRDAALRPVRAGRDGTVWSTARSGFRLEIADEEVHHRVMAVFALPGETLAVRLPDGAAGFAFEHQDGFAEAGPDGWSWTAPRRPGVYAARVTSPAGERVEVNMLVAHPATDVRDGALKGYRIGAYAQEPLRGLDAYLPPAGFVEVGEGDWDVLVSPHFTLGQFLCKQPGEPRFVSYSAPLVRKLEAVLEAVNAAGIDAPTLHVMSGFRTPAYNRAIGNNTVYSRHLWGDAADVFVDVDGDADMDDLNGDGRSDIADARWLASLVDEVERAGAEGIDPGGVGAYRRNAVRGPFVHVDARGYRARW